MLCRSLFPLSPCCIILLATHCWLTANPTGLPHQQNACSTGTSYYKTAVMHAPAVHTARAATGSLEASYMHRQIYGYPPKKISWCRGLERCSRWGGEWERVGGMGWGNDTSGKEGRSSLGAGGNQWPNSNLLQGLIFLPRLTQICWSSFLGLPLIERVQVQVVA